MGNTEFEDDSSSVLNLDHKASNGGIAKEFDAQMTKHKQGMLQEMLKQHVQDPSQLATVNKEAYQNVDKRVRHYQARGLSLAEATVQARAEEEAGEDVPKSPGELARQADREYMGNVSTEELMDLHKPIQKGGSKSGRKRHGKPRSVPKGRAYQQIEDEPRVYYGIGRISESTSRQLDKLAAEGTNVASILAGVAVLKEQDTDEARRVIEAIQMAAPKRPQQGVQKPLDVV